MASKFTYTRIYDAYLGIFSMVMLLMPKMVALAFVLFLILLIVGLVKKELQFVINPIAILFVGLYSAYAIYGIFTRHPEQAAVYYENKLSFLILPILLSFKLKKRLSFQFAISGFIVGTLILVLTSIIHSTSCYFGEGGGQHCFLASEFSYQHHPSYAAVYYVFAIALTWFARKRNFWGFNRYTCFLITFIMVVASMFSLSLAGILYFFGLIAVWLLVLIWKRFGKWAAIGGLILAPLVMYFTIISIPQTEGEWNNAKWYADEYLNDPEGFVKNRKYPMSGTEVRIVMWTVSSKVFKKYPMGVGTGNVDEVLSDHLNQMGQTELAKQEYNPHNQYLQTGVETGIFGIVILLLIIFFTILIAFKFSNWLLLILSTNLAFNMIFESMLQRQSGIIFYAFWLILLAIYSADLAKQKVERE